MCLGVVAILLLNVMDVFSVCGGALLDRPCMVFQSVCCACDPNERLSAPSICFACVFVSTVQTGVESISIMLQAQLGPTLIKTYSEILCQKDQFRIQPP